MPAAPYFDLVLTPNRSLDPRVAAWMVAGLGLVMGLAAVRMLIIGAWPVAPFLLLDVVLVWWAFRASYRSGRSFETVRLDDAALTVRKCDPRGRERRTDLEPFWSRARLERVSENENKLWLEAKDRRVRVGSFLSPDERTAVHAVIADGLDRYRRRS
jgi:uncharacterized membrane protein